MNEENISQPQDTGTDNPGDEERGGHSLQVFDISSDTITPLHDEGETAAPISKTYISSITPLPPKGPPKPAPAPVAPKPTPKPEVKKDSDGLPETPHLVNLINKNEPDKPAPQVQTPPTPTASQPAIKEPLIQTSLGQQPSLPRSPAAMQADATLTPAPQTPPQAPPQKINTPVPTPSPAGSPQTLQSAINQTIEPTSHIPAPPVEPRVHPEIPQDPNIKSLRTYEDDVAEVLARQRASAASIALAESRRKEGSDTIKTRVPSSSPSSHGARNTIITLMSFLMLGGGAFAAYSLYLKSPIAPVGTSSKQPIVSTIIPVDSRASVIVDGLNSKQILDRISEEISRAQPAGTIREIIPATAKSNVILRIASADMIKTMEIEPPDVLMRSLTPEWMIGSYGLSNGGKSAFVIVTTDFFQNTFAGMLQWEHLIADDLKQFLYPVVPLGIANVETGTSTESSGTPDTSLVPITVPRAVSGRFEDKIVRNKDVRAFRTDDGKILFMYSFLDNTKLVITNNEATLSEILIRLEKQAFVR